MKYIIKDKQIVAVHDDEQDVIDKYNGCVEYITDEHLTSVSDEIMALAEKQTNNAKIKSQIVELDSKRSRAFHEPSEKEPGLSWLEFYNREITKLRKKIVGLYNG